MSPYKYFDRKRDTIDLGFKLMEDYCKASSLESPVPEIAKTLWYRIFLANYHLARPLYAIMAACIFAACREHISLEFIPLCYNLVAPIKFALQALWVVEHLALGIRSLKYPLVRYETSAWEDTATYSIVSPIGVGEPKKILLFWVDIPVYTLMGNYNSTNPWLLDIHHRQTLSLPKAVIANVTQYPKFKLMAPKGGQSAREVAAKEVAATEIPAKEVALSPEVGGSNNIASKMPEETESPITGSTSTTAKAALKVKKVDANSESSDRMGLSTENAKDIQASKGDFKGKEPEWTMIDSTHDVEKDKVWLEIIGDDIKTEKNEHESLVASMKRLFL